jgi:hypothetical protein
MPSNWLLPKMKAEPALQDLFLASGGRPIEVAGLRVIQLDPVAIPEKCEIVISFVGERIYEDNAAVIAIREPGRIFLSNENVVRAVAIWDAAGNPRTVRHFVESRGQDLEIYNKYRVFHGDKFCSEDSFTGNAGMIVTEIGNGGRRYQCSNGIGPFHLADLVFEVHCV